MNDQLLMSILSAIGGVVLGVLIAWIAIRKATKMKEGAAISKAQSIIKEAEAEAEVLKKNKILEAKEKFLQLKGEHEKVISEKDKNIAIAENRIKQKEAAVSQKMEQTQRKQQEY